VSSSPIALLALILFALISFPVQIQYLAYIRDKCYESRYKIYAIVAPCKVLIFLVGTVISAPSNLTSFFTNEGPGLDNHTIKIIEVMPTLNTQLPDFTDITSDLYRGEIQVTTGAIWWTLFIHSLSAYICYIFGKFACKIQIQTFSFSLPINLTVPLTVSVLIILCGLRQNDVCSFHESILPDYMFFHVPPPNFLFTYIFKQFVWIWVLWFFSQTWITRHLWRPKGMRNASTEKLFILPMYDTLIVDQSMAMNRRRDEYEEFVEVDGDGSLSNPETMNVIDAKAFASSVSKEGVTARDHVPQIFICATMWHETKEELIEFLKSILRLDEDQCARKMAMKYIQMNKDEIDSEYYDLESRFQVNFNLLKLLNWILVGYFKEYW
jgi:chitin synthase